MQITDVTDVTVVTVLKKKKSHWHDHGRMLEVHISKHSLFRLKITVGCLTSTYPSVHIETPQDHGRLTGEHISEHSQQKLAHVRAVGTSTRADACACAFTQGRLTKKKRGNFL